MRKRREEIASAYRRADTESESAECSRQGRATRSGMLRAAMSIKLVRGERINIGPVYLTNASYSDPVEFIRAHEGEDGDLEDVVVRDAECWTSTTGTKTLISGDWASNVTQLGTNRMNGTNP